MELTEWQLEKLVQFGSDKKSVINIKAFKDKNQQKVDQ